jgi:hypothetical protein
MTTEIQTSKEARQKDPRYVAAKIAQSLGFDIDPDQYTAEVVRTGDKIVLPEGAILSDIINVLKKQDESEKQTVSVNTTINAAPWDGAIALHKAITEELGLAYAKEIPGGWFRPDQPPEEIEVEVELGKTMTVRWGMFELPGMEGAIAQTGVNRDATSGEFVFTAVIKTKRRWEKRARKILDRARQIAAVESVHKGKAFSIRFFDNDGDAINIPTPQFFRFSDKQPIFNTELEAAIERNIFTPIRHAGELQKLGESLKRGILFAGRYGTGKTMLASHIAQVAIQNGWTFIYVKESKELPQALKYAQKFQPVVVFAEDVDRVAGLQRTDSVNNLLNELDGVDSKSAQIMTILTSNHSSQVNAAMRRPGRIDMVMQVLAPNADTIGRMVKSFVGAGLDPKADTTEIGTVLQGYAPAYIKEACGRARLEALRRTGKSDALITGEDLAAVAREVAAEKQMFSVPTEDEAVNAGNANDVTAIATGFAAASKVMKDAVAKAAAAKV